MEYDMLFGFDSGDLDSLAHTLAPALGIVWQKRDSAYLGRYCAAGDIGKERFELIKNYQGLDEVGDEDWIEPDFREYPVVLRVAQSQYPQKVQNQLTTVAGSTMLATWPYFDADAQ